MSIKAATRYLGGLLLAAALLWWVLRGSDPATLWSQLRQASLLGLFLCALFNTGHIVFRVWRWRALLEPFATGIRFRPMFAAVTLGYMVNWIVPGRIGELVRPMLLSGQQPVPLGPCIGSVLADRLLDTATVVALFAVGIWITPLEGRAAEHASLIRAASIALATFVAVGLPLMIAISAARDRLSAWADRRGALVGRISRTVLSLADGVRALRSPRLLARITLHSLLAWITIAAGTWFGVRAAGVDISFGAILVIQPLLLVGVAIPTPGGAGSYHGAMTGGLMFFGVAKVLAVSAAILVHASFTLPLIALGFAVLWIEGISWRHMVAGARQLKGLGRADNPLPAEQVMEGVS